MKYSRILQSLHQAAALAGHWLDLYDHPEDEGCRILKGVKEPHDGPPGAPVYTSTPTITEAQDEDTLEAVQGLTPAKVTLRNTTVSPRTA